MKLVFEIIVFSFIEIRNDQRTFSPFIVLSDHGYCLLVKLNVLLLNSHMNVCC